MQDFEINIPDGSLERVMIGGVSTLMQKRNGVWVDILTDQIPNVTGKDVQVVPRGYTDRFGEYP